MKLFEDVETAVERKYAARGRRSAFRALFYALYSSCVWASTTTFALRECGSARRMFGVVAAFCVVGSTATFAISSYYRRKERIGVGEAVCGILGRTGVPCVGAAAILIGGSPLGYDPRDALKALLVAYFATAPVHFALSFPKNETR